MHPSCTLAISSSRVCSLPISHIDTPLVSSLIIPRAFQHLEDWEVLSLSSFSSSSIDAGGFHTHPTIPLIEKHATVCTKADYLALDPQTTHIVVPSNCANEPEFTSFVMTSFPFLRELIVGDNCFKNILDFIVTGLGGLKNITIGSGSFTQTQEDLPDTGSYLRIKNCPALQNVKIGTWSFLYFLLFDMTSLPSLETMEIGSLDYMVDGADFYFADFELKSKHYDTYSEIGIPHLKSLLLGTSAFHDAEKVTFEGCCGCRE